jgi:hypothetical protein
MRSFEKCEKQSQLHGGENGETGKAEGHILLLLVRRYPAGHRGMKAWGQHL